MSGEDEALMWDILDLTSSSSFPGVIDCAGLATRHEELTPDEHKSPDQELDLEMHREGHNHGPDTSNFPTQGGSLRGASNPVDESASEWPFSNHVDNNPLAAVPDIPDWMIFGHFTEHL
jgi:hypothetical protein